MYRPFLVLFSVCCQLPWSFSIKPATLPKFLIYGGASVKVSNSYPWMAFTYLQNPAIGEMRWCGGVVLDSTTVLSAAHCFHEKPVGKIMVHLLRYNLGKKADEEGGVVVPVMNITIHPYWDRNRAINDFAILKLARALPSQVTSIPIQSLNQATPGSVEVKALGWGLTSATQYPDILQEIEMQVLDEEICVQKYTALNIPFNPTFVLCVGAVGSVGNVCSGDSGGPLISVDAAGNPYLVGITSYSAGCGIDVPAAFARVASQVDWIRSHLGPPPPKPRDAHAVRVKGTHSTEIKQNRRRIKGRLNTK